MARDSVDLNTIHGRDLKRPRHGGREGGGGGGNRERGTDGARARERENKTDED